MRWLSLKTLFAGFLRNRHFRRHFRRLMLFESLQHTTVSRSVPPGLAQTLVAMAKCDPEAALNQLNSEQNGLSETQVEEVRKESGFNEIEHEKPLP